MQYLKDFVRYANNSVAMKVVIVAAGNLHLPNYLEVDEINVWPCWNNVRNTAQKHWNQERNDNEYPKWNRQ